MRSFTYFVSFIACALLVSAQTATNTDLPSLEDLVNPLLVGAGGGDASPTTTTIDIVLGGDATTTTDSAAASPEANTSPVDIINSPVESPAAASPEVGNIIQSPAQDSPVVEPPQATPEPTPSSGLSPGEEFDLDCFDVVDDFEAFDCMVVSENEVNTTDFDCVDFIDEPNFMCTDVNGNELDCEEIKESPGGSGSGAIAESDLLGDLVNSNADGSDGNLGGSAANLQAGASRTLSLLFLRDSAIVGLAMAAGALFVL